MRFMMLFVPVLYAFLYTTSVASAEHSTIVYTRAFADDDYGGYETKILAAIINATPEYGTTKLMPHHHPMPQGRQVISLIQGEADVMWSMTSKERESLLIPIRLPLTMGFAGYRALVIKNTAQPLFPKNLSTDQLKQRTFVQGSDWPDLAILKANGFNVHGETWSLWFSSMFSMVEKHLVDAFPRNIIEISKDIRRHKKRQVSIDKYHLLYYPAYEYFFVRPDQPQLANRIRIGLARLLESGMLESLFNEHQGHAKAMAFINDPARVTHKLVNPLLPYELEYARWDLKTEQAILALRHNVNDEFTPP